mgnify:CR=1 FL=1
MKKDYIIPTIFFIKYEEESELLGNSIHDADSECAAPDRRSTNSMSGKSELDIDNTGNVSDGDYAKKTGWLFDDNAFSDSW